MKVTCEDCGWYDIKNALCLYDYNYVDPLQSVTVHECPYYIEESKEDI